MHWLHRAGAAMATASVLLASGCAAGSPGPAGSGSAAGSRQALAARYLRIARAGNRRLEIDFDGLHGRDRRNLAAARADLRDAAATERLFDQRLMAIVFPPVTEAAARTLFQLNQARARLTEAVAAASTSVKELRAYEQLLTDANAPVERAVRTIRSRLGLPPPETS